MLVVGDAMLDRYWFGAVERISPEAPVPVVRVNARGESASAAPPTSRCNVQDARRAGQLLTRGRRRRAGRRLEALLDEERHRDAVSSATRGLTTTVKLRVIGRPQQLLRIDFENEPDHEVLARRCEPSTSARCAEHDAVLFSDYGKGGLAHIPRHDRAGARAPASRCWSIPRAATTRATAAPP